MRTHSSLLAAGSIALIAACGSPADTGDDFGPNPFVIQTNTADGKTGFVGTFPSVSAGVVQSNKHAFEVTGYSYTFVHKRQLIVTETAQGDAIFAYKVNDKGQLEQTGMYQAPTNSYPCDVVWVDDNRIFVSLASAGKILDMNPNTMTVNKTIDVTGAQYTVGFDDPNDINPNPSSMRIRDGKLFVALWQTKATFVARDGGAAFLVIDVATDAIEKYLVDKRGLVGAGRPGEPDAMLVDEKNDLYLYCSAGFGSNPLQHHGFLRIKSGSTDIDQTYFYDMTAETVALPSQHSDYMNSQRYYKNGVFFVALDDFTLYSNPPDYINDFAQVTAKVDVYNKKTTVLNAPFTNGSAGGATEIVGDTLIQSLATKSNGQGLFTYDILADKISTGPVVTTEGYASVIRKVLP